MKRSVFLTLCVALVLFWYPRPVSAVHSYYLPVEGRILDMKRTLSLAGKLLSGSKTIALNRITAEITKVSLPDYTDLLTDTKDTDKLLLNFIQMNAKELDLQTFGRTFIAENENKPYYELDKYFTDFKKGHEVRFKGSVQGELLKNNTFDLTLMYIQEITLDGKVVYQYKSKY